MCHCCMLFFFFRPNIDHNRSFLFLPLSLQFRRRRPWTSTNSFGKHFRNFQERLVWAFFFVSRDGSLSHSTIIKHLLASFNWQLTCHFNLQDGEIDQYELQEILSLAFANCKYGRYPSVLCLQIRVIKCFVVVVVGVGGGVVTLSACLQSSSWLCLATTSSRYRFSGMPPEQKETNISNKLKRCNRLKTREWKLH